jgi:hypothetical protein
MKNTIELIDPPVLLDEAILAADDSIFSLHVAGVYQDASTRDWAMQICHRATQLAGKGSIQSAWFSAHSLSYPATLLDAVSAALVADVIVVSVHAMDELPIDLYVWFDVWLPRRPARVGALAAVIGTAEPLESRFIRTLGYLQAVAQKAQLDFSAEPRRRPVTSLASPIKQIAGKTGATAPSLPASRSRSYNVYLHGGLNE